jgi:hypothetical protein
MPDLDLIRTIRNEGHAMGTGRSPKGGGQPWRPERLFRRVRGSFNSKASSAADSLYLQRREKIGLTLS